MNESGYYPLGTEFSSDAPWNQSSPKKIEFEVTISQTLSKSVTVTTTDYEEDIDYDGPLRYNSSTYNTNQTNWKEAYRQNHCEPCDLIALLKKILTTEKLPAKKKREYLIKECENWVVDETEVCQ